MERYRIINIEKRDRVKYSKKTTILLTQEGFKVLKGCRFPPIATRAHKLKPWNVKFDEWVSKRTTEAWAAI